MSTEWQSDLCGCLADYPGACFLSLKACCCPCFVLGKTMHRVDNHGSMLRYESLNNDCAIMIMLDLVFGGTGWIYNVFRRGELRQQYGIRGSLGADCLVSYCCLCCALVQQERESHAREVQRHAGLVLDQPPPFMSMRAPGLDVYPPVDFV